MKKSIKKISNIVTQITVGEPDFPGVSPPNMWLVAGFDRCALIDTAYGNVDEIDAFVEAGAIVSNPHLSLWHSFSNQAKGDPTDWLYQVRQYVLLLISFPFS